MMVGLVLVSHSQELAKALVDLVKQIASQDIQITMSAGVGPTHQEFGTDAIEIAKAIQSVYSSDGVLVLMDIGSAVLSADMALELIPLEMRGKVTLCSAPLVEGAISAGLQSCLGSDLETVYREAQSALTPKIEHLGENLPILEIDKNTLDLPDQAKVHTITVQLQNLHGLHARPAARFVQVAATYQADIRVTNASSGKGPASAKSLNALATLGASRGDRLTITAIGNEALPALEALQRLIQDNFGSSESEGDAQLSKPTIYKRTKLFQGESILGIPVSGGIALGKAYRYRPLLLSVPEEHSEHPEEEWECLLRAIENTRLAIEKRQIRLRSQMGEAQSAIFDAHLLFLQDPQLLNRVRERIFFQGEIAAFAWQASITEVAEAYRALADPYQRARSADVIDVGRQVLIQIVSQHPDQMSETPNETVGITDHGLLELPEPVILFAEELTPSEVAQMDLKQVLGLVTVSGGATTHSAILARAFGIPALAGIDPQIHGIEDGTFIGLDGFSGELWIEPSLEVQQNLSRRRLEWLEQRARLLECSHEPACTRDGHRIEVVANIGSLIAAQAAVDNGAEGIGVLRTEFLYLDRLTPPGEDEQLTSLRAIGKVMGERPVIVRTLDVGGDKELTYLTRALEANPYLGMRGLRLSLSQPDLFIPQLRAILRAGADSPIRVMFPMVAIQDDILQGKQLLEQTHQELEKEKLPHRWPIEMGIMVEVPSVALLSQEVAPLVDFFSIGTNDLTQYTLAAERGDPRLVHYMDGLHPAILRLIKLVVDSAHKFGKWVGVCGEVAGDTLAVPVLIGLGVDELSMNPAEIPQVKATLRQIDLSSARRLAKKALKCDDATKVRELVRGFIDGLSEEGY